MPGLWGLRLDQPGAWPEPLVVPPERFQYAQAGPRPGQVLLGLDRGGDERTQLLLLEAPGARPRALTDQPDTMHHFGAWHPDGRQISYASNRRDQRYFDVHLLDVDSGAFHCVLRHDSTNYALGFEPGGERLLVQRVHAPSEHELLLVDPRDGATRSLTAAAPAGRYVDAQWLGDGRVVCATDRDGDLLSLIALDETGRAQTLAEHTWDTDGLQVGPDQRRLVYALNVDGYSEPRLLDLETGRDDPLEIVPGGVCYDAGRWAPTFAWSPDGALIAATITTATTTPDVWLHRPGGPAERLTRSFDADLAPAELSRPELVRYPSFDGLSVPAYLFHPPGGAGGPPPALFYVHGGPESQLRPSFNPVIQYFSQRGFLVVAPNVRGSTGYGKRYSHLDDVEKRPDSVRDLAAGAEWLVARGLADRRRIAVMGGSYGGYMVLASLTERPDLWAAGVEIVGIANFITFLERTGSWRRRHREAEYGSLERDRELLERLSPLRQVDRISAPLLVIHGANDPRVPVHEAEQLVDSLRQRGRPVEYLRFEDEGHGLVKLENRLTAYPSITDFLERHLALDG